MNRFATAPLWLRVLVLTLVVGPMGMWVSPLPAQERAVQAEENEKDVRFGGYVFLPEGLELPPEGKIVIYWNELGNDDYVRVKIRTTRDAANEFLRQPLLSPMKISSRTNFFYPGDDGEWDPDQATRFRSGKMNIESGRTVTILVDDRETATGEDEEGYSWIYIEYVHA